MVNICDKLKGARYLIEEVEAFLPDAFNKTLSGIITDIAKLEKTLQPNPNQLTLPINDNSN